MELRKGILILLVIAFSFGMNSLMGMKDARLLQSPDIYGNKIVFNYGGDLWMSSTTGGDAVRLTSHPGQEFSPYFSPDGKWIAFSGQYDGNVDVFVIPAGGGNPKRLTYHPTADVVTGWSGDGKYIYFSSVRQSHNRFLKIFKISLNGGMAETLPMPMAWYGSESGDGSYFAYTTLSDGQSFATWRRYRGGNAPFIWIFNKNDYSVKLVPRKDSNDAFPRWMNGKVYFLSDRDRVMNLYDYNPQTEKVTQITSYKGADIKSFGAAGGKIVFEREGYLHLMDPAKKSAAKLTVNIPGDLHNIRPGFKKAGRLIYSANVSPTGKRVVFGARGEIVTVPAKDGDIRNLTRTPGKMERTPAWSPDGKSIAYFGEHNNQYALFVIDQKGLNEPKVTTFDKSAYYGNLQWSPDSKKLLFTDHYHNLYYVNNEGGKSGTVKVDQEPGFLFGITCSWSPDSNWIAYTRSGSNELRAIRLYSLDENKSYPVTDGMSDARYPVFEPSGEYLYFTASTNRVFDLGWVDLTNYNHQIVSNIYAVVLAADKLSPFKPESDEEEEEKVQKEGKKGKKEKENEPKKKVTKTRIDLKDIGNRIVSFPIPTGQYENLAANGEILFFLESMGSPGSIKRHLHAYNFKKKKDETILENIDGYRLSADGKKILYRKDRFTWQIVDTAGKAEPGEGMVNTEKIEVFTEPLKEWHQILYEAWRINREYFYDPGMHGQDWEAVWNQYKEYVPYIAHRQDLNYLIGQLIGELCVGHAYVGGGEYPDINRINGGLLGADFKIENGRYRFKKIYQGENWNPELRAPLREPGILVSEGDYLLEVNGNEVKATDNVYSFFEKTDGKQVLIKVNAKPVMVGARAYTVVPIGSEYNVRVHQWIEDNRKKVEALSNGRIGYVHLPDTGGAGFQFFNRYYFAHLDKDAVILDERFNGGGYAADYIIDLLDRPLLNYWKGRWGKPDMTPGAANFGPKAMIINEYAGSGGDAMPYYFRKRGIGKLIGKRTWGGLVGITGYPPLMDGGYVTSPSVAFVDTDGEFSVENEGVAPDIEVEQTPALVIQGHDPQLEAAVKHLLEELKNYKKPVFKHNGFPRGR